MSPTSTLRGLGLGETPLRRWEAVTEMGRSQALIRTIVTPSQRQTIDRGTTLRLTSVGYTDRCVAKFIIPTKVIDLCETLCERASTSGVKRDQPAAARVL